LDGESQAGVISLPTIDELAIAIIEVKIARQLWW
jgi:hypothetical protein